MNELAAATTTPSSSKEEVMSNNNNMDLSVTAAEDAPPAVVHVDSPAKDEEERTVCAFFKENRCRFGDACRQLHEGPVAATAAEAKKSSNKKEKKKKDDTAEEEGKKPAMKTAADVIKRIRWDPLLPEVSHQTHSLESSAA